MAQIFDKSASTELLAHVAMAVNEASSVDAVLRAVPQQVCAAVGWPIGCVCLRARIANADPTVIGWHVSAEWPTAGVAEFQRAAEAEWARKEGMPARVLAGGTLAWASDLAESDSTLRAPARNCGVTSAYAFPIGAPGDVAAVLVFYVGAFHEPSWELLSCMTKISKQLGHAAVRDIERARRIEELQHAQAVFESAADACIAVDQTDHIIEWNHAAATLFGWPRPEALHRSLAATILPVRSQKDPQMVLAHQVVAGAIEIGAVPRTLSGADRSGREFPIEMTSWTVRRGPDWQFYAAIRDISDREAARRKLEQRANQDPLTALPNRAQVLKRLTQLLERSVATSASVAALFVDLDHFKRINDGIGHEAGDTVLKAVAGRFRQAVRAEDMVARIGGDEFVIVCPDLAGPEDASQTAQRVQASLRDPVHVAGKNVSLTASIGVALAERGSTAEKLIAAADAAMYDAKRSGRGRSKHFDPQMRHVSAARVQIENELHEALDRNELRLYYQPIVRAVDGTITALEALLRWQHPTRGLLPPGEFLPIAEESGLIVPMGNWALQEACRCAHEWGRHEADLPIRVSINLSARQLTQPDLAANVDRVLTTADLDPRCIEFGVALAETAAEHDRDVAIRSLQALRALGVRLSIDDFGTGYASLAHLKHLTVDTVKVDLAFVQQVAANSVDRAIVGAVTTLCHALRMQVAAEGVETESQAAVLRELKVDLLQGFLYGRPQPAEALLRILPRRPAGVIRNDPAR